jgi:cellulose synthase/poly-beta-1,6-N-acetylglucosamine synthase-like glycosyltransferase
VNIVDILQGLLALVALPFLGACGYLFLLAILSARPKPPAYGAPRIRFDIVVPAHNESEGIGATVKSLLAIDYPRDMFNVVVVADNCSDDTAARAEAAGATVLVRVNAELRGKGYALAHAFERSIAGGKVQAVVVIDADTLVSPNLLRAFAARIEAGASAVQADYAVRNPDASWRTRLMAIALGMFHIVRSAGRERLRVSCGLRGNGMCFTTAVLQKVPHEAFSIVEDLEYGIRLGEAGFRVEYAGESHVYGEMVSSEKASRSQRQRWEGGRMQMVRLHGGRLIGRALKEKSGVLFDLAMDVLVPPLSTLAAGTVVGIAASIGLAWWSGGPAIAAGVWGACAFCLFVYGIRGWMVSGTGIRGLLSLLYVPFYILWKLTLPFRRTKRGKDEWVRTTREGET